ncbi:hypothetical protein PQX77_016336 [Marasmius sp. AFHP31]|nr:hypothetical protein PQX77_016336 [Marasmius sp. AFHP31]
MELYLYISQSRRRLYLDSPRQKGRSEALARPVRGSPDSDLSRHGFAVGDSSSRRGNLVDRFLPLIPTLRTELTELLAQYAHRWKTVAFDGGVDALDLTPFMKPTSNDLSCPKNFHGSGTLFKKEPNAGSTTREREQLSPLVNILAQAQFLRRLTLDHETISERTFSLPLPWKNLTKLSLPFFKSNSLTPGRIMQMLATNCQSLVTLYFYFEFVEPPSVFDDRRPQAASAAPVRWTSLQDLRMVFGGGCLQYVDRVSLNNDSDSDIATIRSYESNGRETILTFHPIVIKTFSSVVLPSLARFSLYFTDGLPIRLPTLAIDTLTLEDFLQRSQALTHLVSSVLQ